LVDEIIFEAQTVKLNNVGEYQLDSQFINGLPNFTCDVREHIKVQDSKMIHVHSIDKDNLQQVEFHNFPPGSAIALRYNHRFLCPLTYLRNHLVELHHFVPVACGRGLIFL